MSNYDDKYTTEQQTKIRNLENRFNHWWSIHNAALKLMNEWKDEADVALTQYHKFENQLCNYIDECEKQMHAREKGND